MNRPGATPAKTSEDDRYLLAGQASELERLRLQSLVWEPSGRRLLAGIGEGRGARAMDVGCGVLGWLRVLSEWVGPDGDVTGTDIDESMLDRGATPERQVGEGRPVRQRARADSFGLVHARVELGPLRRGHEQMRRVR
jgi:SAM-dependent methyltransferase